LSPVTIHSQVTDRDVVGGYGRDLNMEQSIRDRRLGTDLQPGNWTQGLPTFVVAGGGGCGDADDDHDDHAKDALVREM